MAPNDAAFATITTISRLRFELQDLTAIDSCVVGPLDWDLSHGTCLSLGRHAETKVQQNNLVFKNKVVSRQHAEVWVDDKNKVYIRDTGSSSGTFLNTQRLSLPNKISDAFELKDGDILRIGTTYHGEQFKCVHMRVRILCRPLINTYAMEDCCICLYSISAGQAMFVTPCGHLFHYKCCRPLLAQTPFRCPMCRSVHALDKDVN